MKKIVAIIMLSFIIVSIFSLAMPIVRTETSFSRPSLPDGPEHTNELVDVIVANTTKVLIVTGGWGPLTGISPIQEKDFWISILSEMTGEFDVDWFDGVPTFELLNGYDLVIYDAGGYWYPLSDVITPLRDYHFSGKPTIVVAPDINYDWYHHPEVGTFAYNVLHIEGALGILPDVTYNVYVGKGHSIESSLPAEITVPAGSSWPDCFDPKDDAEGVLIQKFVVTTEFGVGTSTELPRYALYTPLDHFALVAYPGSETEGRVVTVGFPVAALSEEIARQLGRNIIEWSLGKLTGKQMLIQELKALNSETKKALERQVDIFASLNARIYLETYEDPIWETVKLAVNIVAGLYTGAVLEEKLNKLLEVAPDLYEIVKPLSDAYRLISALDKISRLESIIEEVMNELDPKKMSETEIKQKFKNKLEEKLIVDSSEGLGRYVESLDELLENLLEKMDTWPEENPSYGYMRSEVRRIRSWMRDIQSCEKTIQYIDLSTEFLVDSRTVGGLHGYEDQLNHYLEQYKKADTVNFYTFWLGTVGGALIKICGWATLKIGMGVVIGPKAEMVGLAIMQTGGIISTGSSIAKDVFKEKALRIIQFQILPLFIENLEAIGDVYSATMDLITRWDLKGEYAGLCSKFELSQDIYLGFVTDTIKIDEKEYVTQFKATIEGYVGLSSDKPTIGGAVVWVRPVGEDSDQLLAITGNTAEIGPNVCTFIPFQMSFYDYDRSPEWNIYEAVAVVSIGTTVLGPFTKTFIVTTKIYWESPIKIAKSTYSSIGGGESYSESLVLPTDTESLYITLDWMGSDLDLHLFDAQGRHVGMDYATGTVEVEVPNAKYSGPDMKPEWIIIEGGIEEQLFTITVVGVLVEGQEFFSLSYVGLTETTPEDYVPPTTTLIIGIPRYIDLINNVYITSATPLTLTAEDNPGGSGVASTFYHIYNSTCDSGWLEYSAPFYLMGLSDGEYSIDYYSIDNAGNVEPANTATVILFSWQYIYEDTQRGTTLKINTNHKFFQFITMDGDYGIRQASRMYESYVTLYYNGECISLPAIIMRHRDSELLINAYAGTSVPFCYAIARDLQTGKRYRIIIDPPEEAAA